MISILGCGWLGMPLAKDLVKAGVYVKGSTTKTEKLKEISAFHIVPFLIHLNNLDKNIVTDFLENEILLINVPPGRNNPDPNAYVKHLEDLNLCIDKSSIKKVIFISSTSVYKENNSVVTEEGEISKEETAQRLFRAEEIFRNNPKIETTIIRMSGLIGPNRHPGRFFGGKENIPNGLSPVNLIHLDDCIGIIKSVIQQNYWGHTINASALSHPTKKEFYTRAAEKYNGSSASFKEENQQFKIISSEKLIRDLSYEFEHPDLMKWLEA
jgi:nucleoside-diphosphate-sugar epimerase